MHTAKAVRDKARIDQYQTALVCALTCLAFLLSPIISSAEQQISNPLQNAPASQIAAAYGNERTYEVTRNGKSIGTHTIRFNTTDNTLEVSVNASIAVTILKVPVYRLDYVAKEIWIDDKMIESSATTTENGDSTTATWNSTNAANNAPRFSTNHWHPGVLAEELVFNTLTGENSRISVTRLGPELVPTRNGEVDATRYRYGQEIEADVWYDADGLWLKLSFTQDRSKIEYLRID